MSESVERKQLPTRPPVAPAPRCSTDSPTLRPRPEIRPRLRPGTDRGYPSADPYVRRYWTAAIGHGAVSDLMRLIRAAQTEGTILRPTHTAEIIRLGMAGVWAGGFWVVASWPNLPVHMVHRLPVFLRREHRAAARELTRSS